MDPKDQVKENLSIVDVVSTYIRLEKSGSQFRARCPFHNEKTPSFYVSQERKSFHCFGCQEHGDIFTFVEKVENIPFYEALKILADRAGVSLKDSNRNKVDSRLISLLKDSTNFFEENLSRSSEARQYLIERGLTEETIKTFHIGFAKNEWRDLFVYLSNKGYTPEEMEQAGLEIKAIDNNGQAKGWYDRFRGRIIFPIRNISGATVGYSGRILPSFVDPSVTQGKYVNSPETVLYHKSKILFGYDTAKKVMNETKEVIVVEGQMDLCMSYQSGIENTIAVSGTAFTDEQIKLIKRFCDRVILSFDNDKAGQNALRKSSSLCLLGGLDVFVIGEIGQKDPADLIIENKQLWFDAIKNKKHIVEYMTMKVLEEVNDERERGRRVVLDVLPYVRLLQSYVDKDHFIKYISSKTGITEESLKDELSRGLSQIVDVIAEEESIKNIIPAKERVTRELIALINLKNLQNKKEIQELNLDLNQFPEAILQEEMFSLEEKLIGNVDNYLRDLINTYNREIKKEKIEELQTKLREEGNDHEKIMKELQELMKG